MLVQLLCLWELQSVSLILMVGAWWRFCFSQAELGPPGDVTYLCPCERSVLDSPKCSWTGWRIAEVLTL